MARALGAPGDIEGLVDDWGFGFVNELDYQQEANNAEAFMASFQGTPLEPVVFSPPVVRDCSARRVLTTEWIEGERLEKSSAEDVSTLCSVAMNTYLTMMLQTGTMHRDPHPGNLFRKDDGQLAILETLLRITTTLSRIRSKRWKRKRLQKEISKKTGRKVADIRQDIRDDGSLNLSAGSDVEEMQEAVEEAVGELLEDVSDDVQGS